MPININTFKEVANELPLKSDQLVLAFLPGFVDEDNKELRGPVATAFYSDENGWIYADTPEPLLFTPTHWQELLITAE